MYIYVYVYVRNWGQRLFCLRADATALLDFSRKIDFFFFNKSDLVEWKFKKYTAVTVLARIDTSRLSSIFHFSRCSVLENNYIILYIFSFSIYDCRDVCSPFLICVSVESEPLQSKVSSCIYTGKNNAQNKTVDAIHDYSSLFISK